MPATCSVSISGILSSIEVLPLGSGVHTGTTSATPLNVDKIALGVSVGVGVTVPVGSAVDGITVPSWIVVGVIVAVGVAGGVYVPVGVTVGVFVAVPVAVAGGVAVGVFVADVITALQALMLKFDDVVPENEKCNITELPLDIVMVGIVIACGDVFDVPLQ